MVQELFTKTSGSVRVVVVGDTAWTLDLLREKGRIEKDDVVITWEPGQNSALNTRAIADGRDVGNVVAQKRDAGGLKDIVYDVTFAFVFLAFKPDGTFIDQSPQLRAPRQPPG